MFDIPSYSLCTVSNLIFPIWHIPFTLLFYISCQESDYFFMAQSFIFTNITRFFVLMSCMAPILFRMVKKMLVNIHNTNVWLCLIKSNYPDNHNMFIPLPFISFLKKERIKKTTNYILEIFFICKLLFIVSFLFIKTS